MATEYEKIFGDNPPRGRATLPPEEKERRERVRKAQQNRAAKARYRAYRVLASRHAEEYDKLYEGEYGGLADEFQARIEEVS